MEETLDDEDCGVCGERVIWCTCDSCGGSGWCDDRNCPDCGGDGEVPVCGCQREWEPA